MIRLGVGSWTLPWAIGFKKNTYEYPRISVEDLLRYASENSIDLVQLYNNIPLASFSEQQISAIGKMARGLNIEIAVGGEGISKTDLSTLLRIGNTLLSKSVRTVIPQQPHFQDRDAEIDAVISQISISLPEFEKHGVMLLLENHDRYSSSEYLRIVKSLESPWLKMCFDTGNGAGRLENWLTGLKTLQEVTHCIHYKEISIKRLPTNLGFIIEGCRPGDGENVSPELFQWVKSMRQPIDIVLEQWVSFHESVEKTLAIEREWANEGIRIMKALC